MVANVQEQPVHPLRAVFQDLRITRKGLKVEHTGHYVPLEWATVVDVVRWLTYDGALRLVPTLADRPIKIAFTPHTARRWYFARAIVEHLGAEVVEDPADAELVWAFDDATFSDEVMATNDQVVINGTCTDISKTRINEIMQSVFGYALAADPETYDGPMVEKSEINGAHDGRIVQGPAPRREGFVYQRLVDNQYDDNRVEDLRTTIVGGKPVLVFRKRRPMDGRFANTNTEVVLTSLDEVFTMEERNMIGAFAQELGLDAGGLDVLRDRHTGKLFIVDANKTDMGPPMALPLNDKLKATHMMAEALAEEIQVSYSTSRAAARTFQMADLQPFSWKHQIFGQPA
ncbi:hypothetical protein [Parvularcula maris]|uniref:ATP-grasp domain-containing protein n=1 Tax=Parvularcula maris TaxID=2965077 RepID=A0A9X2L7P5_9PROT|nr:hypothetical protein [Parvularcula maris]MCQ8184464.1 hypothetical protein [Parvularcula maris]